jgi:NAD(P)-dependent dehydrogenase (short-subunit alcohol dehydrogenase family)
MSTTAPTPTSTAAAPLLGRTALVTGASRGIGAAVARRLDLAGARVAVAGRTTADLRAVAGALDHEPVVLEADLADPDAPAALADAAVAALGGRVDVLVNNAGAFAGAGRATSSTRRWSTRSSR